MDQRESETTHSIKRPKAKLPPGVTRQERDKEFQQRETGPRTAEDQGTRDKPMPVRPEEVKCDGGLKATDRFASTTDQELGWKEQRIQ